MNGSEINPDRTPSRCAKAALIAKVIRALGSPSTVASLPEAVKEIHLHASSRDIIISLLSNGTVSDVANVTSKICASPSVVYYSNQIEICEALASRLRGEITRIPEYVLKILGLRNFWEFMSASDRRVATGDVLPLQNFGNRTLLVRLTAYTAIALSRAGDEETLRSLVNHRYKTVSQAAALQLSRLMGESALDTLVSEIEGAMASGRAAALARAIRVTECGRYEQRTEEEIANDPHAVPNHR
jgi:hypothetical protein